ncbi:hypothetical protein BJ508DRAFT_127362 [Ascobolus immersus RN42]|uniref:Uncharacterized protein n=1 Tax=Ascobolus immersus RN42 TaxID=1160509 RepID=A0A3N4I5D0_ASCIM|nr:hypothetical protein BJ508DRAFT_127362 [Ascobolus immersus RN42]
MNPFDMTSSRCRSQNILRYCMHHPMLDPAAPNQSPSWIDHRLNQQLSYDTLCGYILTSLPTELDHRSGTRVASHPPLRKTRTKYECNLYIHTFFVSDARFCHALAERGCTSRPVAATTEQQIHFGRKSFTPTAIWLRHRPIRRSEHSSTWHSPSRGRGAQAKRYSHTYFCIGQASHGESYVQIQSNLSILAPLTKSRAPLQPQRLCLTTNVDD